MRCSRVMTRWALPFAMRMLPCVRDSNLSNVTCIPIQSVTLRTRTLYPSPHFLVMQGSSSHRRRVPPHLVSTSMHAHRKLLSKSSSLGRYTTSQMVSVFPRRTPAANDERLPKSDSPCRPLLPTCWALRPPTRKQCSSPRNAGRRTL